MIGREYIEDTAEIFDRLQEMPEGVELLREWAANDTTGNEKKFSENIELLKKRYDELRTEYVRRVRVILKCCGTLPFRERYVIIAYYLLGDDTEVIAYSLHTSKQRISQIRRSAIKRLSETPEDQEKQFRRLEKRLKETMNELKHKELT